MNEKLKTREISEHLSYCFVSTYSHAGPLLFLTNSVARLNVVFYFSLCFMWSS